MTTKPYIPPKFAAISVGDTVARIRPYGWHGEDITKHTVTRKTKVQVTLDNGERYGKYLKVIGELYSDAHIVPWDSCIDERLAEARSDALNKRVINGLQGIVWSTVSNETRRRAAKALLDAGVPVGYVLEGDLT